MIPTDPVTEFVRPHYEDIEDDLENDDYDDDMPISQARLYRYEAILANFCTANHIYRTNLRYKDHTAYRGRISGDYYYILATRMFTRNPHIWTICISPAKLLKHPLR